MSEAHLLPVDGQAGKGQRIDACIQGRAIERIHNGSHGWL